MQVTVEKSSALQRRLTVQVPGEEVQKKIDARLREIGKTAKLKGFRPGRIPMKVLKQRYGPSVRHEIVTQTMQSSLYEALQQEALRPATSPVIESVPELKSAEDLEFTATIEVYPELDKIDTSSIAIKKPNTEVAEDDIDDMLQTLREQRQSWNTVERKPADGDQVVIEYVADTGTDRVPEQGKQRLALVLGTSGFKILEQAVSGLEAGGETTVKLKFPEEYGDQALAGKSASVELTVVSVQERHIPEIDEDFIKSFAIESGDMDELRTEVRGNLERELKTATTAFLKTQLLEQLVAMNPDLEVPLGIVREEAEGLLKRDAQRQGIEPDPAKLDAYLDKARYRVKCGLLLGELGRQNNLLIDGARVRQAIETVADTYEQPREVVQMYYNNPELLKAVEVSVLEEQVVDWVMDHAKVNPEPMAFKDVINAAAQARQGS